MKIIHVPSHISRCLHVTCLLYITYILTFTNAQQMFLESTLLRCNDEMAHEIIQHPIRQATSSAIGQTLDLKVYSKCRKKLLITLRVAEEPKLFIPDALILIDRAKNTLTHQTSHFGVPLVLKFHQDPLIQKYPLRFLYRVNAKMWEEVINSENSSNYTGCNNNPDTKSPTCGFIKGRKEVAGFCCTCTDHKNNVQPRGGHRCDVPKESSDLLTSAHCLHSSAYTYNVYELKPPSLFQKLRFDVFLGNETGNGSISWAKMSNSKNGVEVDADCLMNASGSVKVSYRPHTEGVGQSQSIFNSSNHRLLLPVPNPFVKAEDYPNPLKGPLEDRILVVPKSLMAPRGAHCDLVGTRIEAFVNQPDACRRERNTCLKNQPFDLWMQDQGEHGDPKSKFRLKSFGALYDNMPLNFLSDFITGSLYMRHSGDSPSFVDIEIPADDVVILSPGYNAFIEFVLSDTGHDGVKVVTQAFNRELAAADFSIDLLHCSMNISRKVTTKPKRIGPLSSVTFHQDLNPFQVSQPVFCFVVLVNEHGEAIAAREVVFRPSETCICSHTCKCVCGSRSNLKCERLSNENIIAAGLISEVETAQDVLKSDEALFYLRSRRMFHWMLIFFLILISLVLWGALKGLLGLVCCPPIASYGMEFYQHKFGASRNPSNIEIFWYNTTFFIFLPLIIVWWIQNPGSAKSPRNSKISTVPHHKYDEEEYPYSDSGYDLEPLESAYDQPNTDSELDHNDHYHEHADTAINHENEMQEDVNVANTSQGSEASEVTLYERNSFSQSQSVDTVVNDKPSETGESTAVSASESKVDSSTKSAKKKKKKKEKSKKSKKKKSADKTDLATASSGVKRKPINSYPFSAPTPDAASASAMQRKQQMQSSNQQSQHQQQKQGNNQQQQKQGNNQQQQNQSNNQQKQNQSNNQQQQKQGSSQQQQKQSNSQQQQKQGPSQQQQQQKSPQPPQQGQQQPTGSQQGKGKSAPVKTKTKDKKEHKPHRLRSLAGPGTGISERSIIVSEDPTPVHFPGSGGPQGETSWDVRRNSSNNNTNYPDFTLLNISASSSKTSFGTWHRRRREQFSAYDFLPESKHRQSYTNYFDPQ